MQETIEMPAFQPCQAQLRVPLAESIYVATFECEYDKGHFGVHVGKGEVIVEGRKVWWRMTWRGDADPEWKP
jgi:hypothetical protein